MREILFRGKTKNKHREWIIGLIGKIRNLDDEIEYYITEDPEIENIWLERQIDPSTLGQYTGLTDKNGRKVFEGDIVMFGFSPCVVKYDLTNSRYMFYDRGIYLKNGFNVDTMKTKEVVGNITDNPELLDGE